MTAWDKIKLGVLGLLVLVIACGVGWLFINKASPPAVAQIDQTHLTDVATLKKALDIQATEAQQLAKELAAAQNKPAQIHYVTLAPTVEQAATYVEKEIKAGTSPANQISADKTIVTPNVKDQKVDVYRVTMDKAKWGVSGLVLAGGSDPVEVGAGVSYHNKDWSASVGGTSRSRVYVMGTKYF